jgi:hypothetical protein
LAPTGAAALGTDTSSNGNDWTVNNIIADFSPSAWDYSQNWATYLSFTTDGGGFLSGRSPGEVCFDGTRVENSATGTTGTNAYIEVSGLSLTASDTLEITLLTTSPGSLTWQVTGTNLTTTNISTNAEQFVEIPITGAATTFRISSTSSARAHLTAIRINGKELILISYLSAYLSGIDSLVDTPTNGSQTDTGVGGEVVGNYCTFNPLDSNSGPLSNGNLDLLGNNINFGQRPFAYTAPSGFKALCTTNLPEPTIADGSTAMDVKYLIRVMALPNADHQVG